MVDGATRYASLFSKTCHEYANLVVELLKHKICPKCIARFLGERDKELYAEQPPALADLVAACLATSAPKEEGQGLVITEQADSAQDAACPICLGILQQGSYSDNSDEGGRTGQTSAMDMGEDSCVAIPSISVQSVVQAIRTAGHTSEDFALELMVPQSIALREVSVWHWLKANHPESKLLAGRPFPSCIVDIKDAIRMSLAPGLAQELGWRFCQESALRVSLRMCHEETAGEPAAVLQQRPKAQSGHKRGREEEGGKDTAHSGKLQPMYEAALRLPAAEFHERLAFPPPTPSTSVSFHASVWRQPLLLAGRYLKQLRGMPQSPWICDEERVGTSSVQEALESVLLPVFRADSCKMIAAGREDLDVRMMGSGRPFVMEISNARASMPPQEQLRELQAKLEDAKLGASVVSLQAGTKAMLAALKEGEEHKRKTYEALCWAERPLTETDVRTLDAVRELTVQQGTPVRVLHRRAALTRPKIIHSMQVRLLAGQPQYFVLRISTQAGTYIKEFVNGDFGRSSPSVGSLLGCRVEIVQLDVVDVDMEFP